MFRVLNFHFKLLLFRNARYGENCKSEITRGAPLWSRDHKAKLVHGWGKYSNWTPKVASWRGALMTKNGESVSNGESAVKQKTSFFLFRGNLLGIFSWFFVRLFYVTCVRRQNSEVVGIFSSIGGDRNMQESLSDFFERVTFSLT